MYGILGIGANEASRVQTKHDLSFKSLLQNSPYRKDVLRIFAMPGIKTSWSNFRWRQLVEEGPVKQRSLKDPFNAIKENCSSSIQCLYSRSFVDTFTPRSARAAGGGLHLAVLVAGLGPGRQQPPLPPRPPAAAAQPRIHRHPLPLRREVCGDRHGDSYQVRVRKIILIIS